MKDYKLSEIKKICESHKYCHQGCPFYIDREDFFCAIYREVNKTPSLWDIDKEEDLNNNK